MTAARQPPTRQPPTHQPRGGRRRLPRRRRALLLVATVVVLGGAAVLVTRGGADDSALAGEAVVSASSTALGFSARDVVGSGSTAQPGPGWQSDNQTIGAWIQLTWPQAHRLHRIDLVRDSLDQPGVTAGFLNFSDGSYVQVRLSTDSRDTTVFLTPRAVTTVRFTVAAVSAGSHSAVLDEIVVSGLAGDGDVLTDAAADGNAGPAAAVSTDAPTAAASDPRALLDGTGGATAAGIGRPWTLRTPVGTWVQLDWARPRELSSVELIGWAGSSSQLSRATLTFSDGSSLPVGAVLPDPLLPTIVSFLPHTTRSVRLTIDQVRGDGALSLGELRAYRVGAVPERPTGGTTDALPAGSAGVCSRDASSAAESRLTILCPASGSSTGGRTVVQVTGAAGHSEVSATVWPGDGSAPGDPVREQVDVTGSAALGVDVSAAPPGPLTVAVTASGGPRPDDTVYLQLYRSGAAVTAVPSSGPSKGRSLVYAEEFDKPISLSRNGTGAQYAGAKPTYFGVQDFGAAVFSADAGQSNISEQGGLLRIGVQPTPPGYRDPSGYGRTYLGGLLSSARPGGSGFSAQYGYFEARMLAPAAPGTWPAFWLLPNDNLIAATPTVAEIDAVELYGHDPTGACESTHSYRGGTDRGIAHCGTRFATPRAALGWHTYGVAVSPTDITFYIDGRVTATAPQVPGGDAPMFFLVDLALGGGWPVDLQALGGQASLYVDDIRVYV